MQIKELIIKNFKSFNYSTIPFKDGFQIVVGPNGSGKSNIVDALLFAFGETSLKKLRVDKLSDLVNHNSKSKAARVRVVFTHEDQKYEIVREIDDAGKSVFILNEKRKALNEITSFLEELGISSSGYNTVQQGDVTRIINLSAEERRKIIEDLSGISLFDERKKEAENNLKKVDKRLEKVSIALNERKPYVEQLAQEKEDALAYKKLEKEEKIYNVNLLLKQKDNYFHEEKIEQEKVSSYLEEIQEKELEKKELLTKEQEHEQKLDEINTRLINHSERTHESVGKKHVEVLSKKEILQNNVYLKENNIKLLIDEKNNKQQEHENIQTETKKLLEDTKKLREDVNLKEKERKQVKENIEKNKETYDQTKKEQIELYDQINKINLKIEELQEDYFENKNKITSYDLEQENKKKEEEKKKERITSLKDFKKNIFEEKEELQTIIKTQQKIIEQKTKEIEQKIKEQEEKVVLLAEKKANIDALKKEKKLYLNLKENKEVVKEKLKLQKNFVGFLEDVVSLKEEQKTYFSRFLVFKNNADLENKIKEIEEYGQFSIICLDVLDVDEKELSKVIEKKYVSSKDIKKIKGYFFDGFCYKKISFKKRESVIKELEKEQKEYDEETNNLEKLKEKIREEDIKIKEEKNKFSDYQVLYNTKVSFLEDVEEKLLSEEKTNVVEREFALNVGQIKQNLTKIEEQITHSKNQKKETEQKLSGISISEQENLRDQYDTLTNEINDLKQKLIEKTSKQQMLEEKQKNLKNYLEENTTRQESLQKDLKDLKAQEEKLEQTIKDLEEQINEANKEKQNLFAEKSKINQELSEVSKKLSSIDFVISDIRASVSEANMNINNLKNKLEQIEENLTFFDDISDIEEIDFLLEEIQSKLRKTRREKNALGNINFNAIDTYNKLAKEYEDILEKHTILLKEKEEVRNMLAEINLKKQKIFMDCYRQINNEFVNVIAKMSNTLSGSLELLGEEPLESKLLINITKNKKTKNIDIMSGGEKAITALAFIFAINAYKKYSFYVLDEVDAALDDLNSKNLLNYIRDLSKKSNIISISHNNLLVNGADQVIGVTLKEHSSVIGLNI